MEVICLVAMAETERVPVVKVAAVAAVALEPVAAKVEAVESSLV